MHLDAVRRWERLCRHGTCFCGRCSGRPDGYRPHVEDRMRFSHLLSCAVPGVLSAILLGAPELLMAQIAVTPDNGSLSSLSNVSGQSVSFTFRWTGTGNAK